MICKCCGKVEYYDPKLIHLLGRELCHECTGEDSPTVPPESHKLACAVSEKPRQSENDDGETVEMWADACTFCGWGDAPEVFDFHTPGGAPVCNACAIGLLGMTQHQLTEIVEFQTWQGDSNYKSGIVRLKTNDGRTIHSEYNPFL